MRQYWIAPLPPFHTADGPTTAPASILGDMTPTPPVVIPANMLEVGSRLEINCFGRFTTAATPGTVVVGLYLAPTATATAAGNAVCVTAALAPIASQTNRTFRIEGNASIRTVGATTAATIIASLEVTNVTGSATAPGTDIAPATAPATFGFDSTVANSVRLGITPNVATQSWVVHYFGVRLVN